MTKIRRAHIALVLVAGFLAGCGGDSVAIPDVVGEEEDFARGLVIGQGLTVDVVERETPDVPQGQVLTVAPAPGTEVGRGQAVTLTVAVWPEYRLRGTFELIDSDVRNSNGGCYGTGGYDDIREGLGVTVRDGSGSVLATSRLGIGSLTGRVTCTFRFEVDALPKEDFYSIEVGRRGELTYSFGDLESSAWKVELSLS